MAISFPDTVSAAVEVPGGALRADPGSNRQSQTVITGNDCRTCPAVKSRQSKDDDFHTVLVWMIGGINSQFLQTPAIDTTKTAPTPAATWTDAGSAADSRGIGSPVEGAGAAAGSAMGDKSAPSTVSQDAAGASYAVTSADSAGVGTPEGPIRIQAQSDQENVNPESTTSESTSPSTLPTTLAAPVSRLSNDGESASENSDSVLSVLRSLLFVSERPVSQALSMTVPGLNAIESKTLSGTDTLAAAFELNPESAVQPLSIPVLSQTIESMIRPVRNCRVSAAVDNSGFRHSRELHSGDGMSSNSVPGGNVQLNAANSTSEVATPVSGEVRQPLSHQVSQAIMQHIENHSVRSSDSLTVRLDPPELGEMSIELSKTLDGLAVRVTAREAVTMRMLLTRGHEPESHLQS